LKNLIKVEIQDKIVLNTKGTELTPKLGTELTPKLSIDMVSPTRKLLFEV
jgi:hypothetical protein